ncbi:probable G-protein coupled receptor tkr-1 [Paramacrobiotus metropolitanus]|uniref:probable G-protein coupled receptor tkr-1 n=1 Tax=Paramacrobiotus metropolitanus TaxID=2943436 RepID=UPI0024461F77|nr:probable G-protein coupled receptor tkr-1 [Paramacrobiotus metropolitanus]
MCLIIMPLLTTQTSIYPEPTEMFCTITMFFCLSVIYTVNWISLMIAINRVVAILFPYSYRYWARKRTIITMILISWMIPAVCNVLVSFRIGATFQLTEPWGACGVKVNNRIIFPLMTVICVAFPVGLEGVIYLCIFAILTWRKVRKVRRISVVASDSEMSAFRREVFVRRVKVTRMLFLSNVWYMVCFLPAPISSSLYPKQYISQPLLQLYFRSLLAMGYATIPLIYVAFNNDYRNGIREFWRKARRNLGSLMGLESERLRKTSESTKDDGRGSSTKRETSQFPLK